MTFKILIGRSLRFHAKAHLGVVLGATIGSAALIGALLVGDSLRDSLRQMALARLGNVHFALTTLETPFQADLPERLCLRAHSTVLPNQGPYVYPASACPMAAVLAL